MVNIYYLFCPLSENIVYVGKTKRQLNDRLRQHIGQPSGHYSDKQKWINKLKVIVENGIKELVIREGEAEILREPKIVTLKGTIGSPAEYFAKRKDINPLKCNVVFSYINMKIVLVVEETDHFGTTVIGQAVLNPDLVKFGINSSKIWIKNDLKTFLKMNRAFFKESDEAMQIVANLEKFSAQVQAKIDDAADNRGNSKKGVEITVSTDLKMSFVLNIPIYIGQPKSTFTVEICFSVTDGGVTIWLESPELQEAIIKQRETLIDENLKPFRKDFVVIEE